MQDHHGRTVESQLVVVALVAELRFGVALPEALQQMSLVAKPRTWMEIPWRYGCRDHSVLRALGRRHGRSLCAIVVDRRNLATADADAKQSALGPQ